MKKLDLLHFDVQQLNTNELKNNHGGCMGPGLILIAIAAAITLLAATRISGS